MLNKISDLPGWLAGSEKSNVGTLWQVVKAYRANLRQGTVGVKTRAMVRSTGKKPYAQKHMGRARRGSFVSPINAGGGVAHGPKARDYRQHINKKMGRAALRIALAKKIVAGDAFGGELSLSGKTKEAAVGLKGIHGNVGKTVVCLPDYNVESLKALRNIRGLVLRSPSQLTALDVVVSRKVVFVGSSLDKVGERIKSHQVNK